MKKLIYISLFFILILPVKAQFESLLSRGVQISMVTVDPDTWHNMIVWQRPNMPGLISKYGVLDLLTIDSYTIMRWDSASNNYLSIGSVPFALLPVFIDTSSRPDVRSYKYKIKARINYSIIMNPVTTSFDSYIDSCHFHKTVHVKRQIVNDTVKIDIEPYEVQNYDIKKMVDTLVVYIYRSTDSLNIMTHKYDSIYYIAGQTKFKFIDKDPNAFDSLYYYCGALNFTTPIDPIVFVLLKSTSGPFSQSISNLEDNRLKATTSIKELKEPSFGMSVSPNPLTAETILTYNLNTSANVRIQISDLNGRIIAIPVKAYVESGSFSLNLYSLLRDISGSLVFVSMISEGKIICRKVFIP